VTRVHQRAPDGTRQTALPVSRSGDRFEREADRIADAVMRGETVDRPRERTDARVIYRAAESSAEGARPNPGAEGRAGGEPLEPRTRAMMEQRLGFDFGRVRVHTDAPAAESARAERARAYTVGTDIVFGAGQYAPGSREGQRLIAHELTHVQQQTGAAPMLQRWNIFDEIGGWFAGDDFDPTTLTTYLGERAAAGRIEDHSDSDNKARAVVKAWKKDRSAFTLTPLLKVILIKEMQSGFTGNDDEQAILDLLTSATDDELTQFFTTLGLKAKDVASDFHGDEDDRLMDFFATRFKGGYDALKKGQVTVEVQAAKTGGATKEAPAAPPKPRLDYVFIMGEDSARAKKINPFYTMAEKYFRVHYPNAEMITSERSLEGLLSYIDRNVKDPIGHLYVVSHGNEDGTLSFGLDPADLVKDPEHPKSIHGDSHLSPMELKEAMHPEGGGKSTLISVAGKIDEKTTIHIRGCDLGQNKEFVNLIDEAFGGKGRVIASTHEQRYGTDPVLAERARAQARKAIEESEPMPPPIDPAIKDAAARKAAKAERDKALKDRQTRIKEKLADQKDEIEEAAALAGTFEAMSGVVMQRPGSTKFTEEEITAEVNRRYAHLLKKQRAGLVRRMLVGQKAERETLVRFKGAVPENSAQARVAFAGLLRKHSFIPDKKRDVEITKTKADDKETRTYKFFDASGAWIEVPVEDIPLSDAGVLKDAMTDVPNPGNYTWVVTRTRQGAQLTIAAVGRRVFVDLHHQSLDAKAHEPFTPPETDPIFYVRSSFEPKDTGKKKDDRKK
jgi:hypothetical protein